MNPLEQSLEKQLENAEDLLDKRLLEIEKLEDQVAILEDKLEGKDTEIEQLEQKLKEAKADDEKYLKGWADALLEYGFPEWDLMAYQKEMVRQALDYIRTHDTLKGLGE